MPALSLLTIGLAALFIATLVGGPASGHYLVIASPGTSLGESISIVRAAHGGLVKPGRFANMVIANSKDADFPEKLHKAGALLVLNTPETAGCFAIYPERLP